MLAVDESLYQGVAEVVIETNGMVSQGLRFMVFVLDGDIDEAAVVQ